MIKKQRYTPEKLLKLVKKKFDLEISLSQFWSEALLAVKNLETIKPLLIDSASKQTKDIQKIQEYFQKNSAQYLRRYF